MTVAAIVWLAPLEPTLTVVARAASVLCDFTSSARAADEGAGHRLDVTPAALNAPLASVSIALCLPLPDATALRVRSVIVPLQLLWPRAVDLDRERPGLAHCDRAAAEARAVGEHSLFGRRARGGARRRRASFGWWRAVARWWQVVAAFPSPGTGNRVGHFSFLAERVFDSQLRGVTLPCCRRGDARRRTGPAGGAVPERPGVFERLALAAIGVAFDLLSKLTASPTCGSLGENVNSGVVAGVIFSGCFSVIVTVGLTRLSSTNTDWPMLARSSTYTVSVTL